MKKVVLIITFLIASISMVAQSFPVQLIPQAVPPQSVYISDYANGFTTSDRLRLQILLTDLTVLNREVRLKVYLEGEGIFAESRDFVIGASNIFIDGGVPIQLGSADLAPYFEFQNLQNINQNVYASALPEGIYQFCFEIYDVLSGNRLSQKTCASSILFQNAPPFLTAPLNESVFEYQDIYNILFQWTPRHINVTNVQYEMTLVQIYDNYVDPQAAFLSSTPIFQQVTNTTTLLYDQSFPPLIPGYKYAWRVRAFARNGADEISVFDNQGFSEIWSFTYIEACEAPLTLAEETIGIDHAQITWQGSQSHLDYKISYREKNANSSWYVRNTPREYITINGLKPATSYQYKVAGNCDLGSFEYSPIKEFTTLANVQDSPNYVCDIPPGTIDLSNQTLLPELLINDLFFANDFPITVLELTSATAPFTGKGYIGIPWLNFARIGVQFNGIQINDDFKMVAGFVETTYDADWSNVNFIDEYTDFLEGDNDIVEVDLDFDVDTIVIINGEVIITGTNGVVVTYPNTDDLVITDVDGTTYVIPANSDDTPEGTSIDPVTTAEGGSIDTASTPGFTNGVLTQLSTEGVKVTFSEASNAIYGFDRIQENYREELDANYENIKDIDGTNYDVVYKAIEKSKTDEIIANITTNDVSKLDNLVFKTKNGILIPHTLSTDKLTATLTVKGLFGYESVDVYATIVKPQDSTETIAGVFKAWHLTEKVVNVTLVSVNGASIPSDAASQINAIYKKAAVTFNINEDLNFNIDSSVWGDGDIEVGDSGLLSHYTDDEKAIYNAYKDQNGVEEEMFYVFITDTPSSNSANGFMKLKGKYGFIFKSHTDGTNIGKVIAHELGHGAFALEHPYKTYQGISKNSGLPWLMEYNQATQLPQMDWAQIHNPKFKIYLFQDDKDGEASSNKINAVLNHIQTRYNGDTNTVLNWKGLVYKECESINPRSGMSTDINCNLKGHYSIPTNDKELKFRLIKQPSASISNIEISNSKEGLKIKKRRIVGLGDVYDLFYQLTLEDNNSNSKFVFEFKHHDDIEAFCKYLGIQGNNIDPGQAIIEDGEDLTNENAQEILNLPDGATVIDYYKSVFSNYEELLEARSVNVVDRTNISQAIINHLDRNYLPNPYIDINVDCNDIDVYFAEIPANHASALGRESLWNALISLLSCNVDQNYANEEKAVLTIIKSLSTEGNETDFLDGLLSRRVDDDTIFKRLFRKMDDTWFRDDNFTNFIKLLTDIWKRSDHYKPANYEVVPYSNSKQLGFYVSDYKLIFTKPDYDKIRIQEIVGYEYSTQWINHEVPPRPIYDDVVNPPPGIYQTVLLIENDKIRSDFSIPAGFIPMFVLKALVTKNDAKNWVNAGVLTFDVVTTLSGVGNLAKLRHLRHLKHLGKLNTAKIIVGAAEVTLGSLGLMLDYSDACQGNGTQEQTERCKKIRTFLLVFEMATLSGDIAMSRALKRSADEALTAAENFDDIPDEILDDLRLVSNGATEVLKNALRTKFAGKTKVLEWIDDINNGKILEHLDELPATSFSKFEDDILSLKVHFETNPSSIKAWETIIGNPQIRKDITTLTSISKLLNNSNISSVINKDGIRTIVNKLAKKGVKCRTCTGGNSKYKYLDEILDDIEFGAIKYGDEYSSVLTGFKQGGNFMEGAMFVASSLKKYPDEFPIGTAFEFTEVTVGGVRRVDVKVGDTFYEFKSVIDVPPSGFAIQFIKDLDLEGVTRLDQLKWWFDGNKINSLPKQDFINLLNDATISQEIINKIVINGPKTKQALINLIDTNFNLIFHIK